MLKIKSKNEREKYVYLIKHSLKDDLHIKIK